MFTNLAFEGDKYNDGLNDEVCVEKLLIIKHLEKRTKPWLINMSSFSNNVFKPIL